jgi:hypothetical protein
MLKTANDVQNMINLSSTQLKLYLQYELDVRAARRAGRSAPPPPAAMNDVTPELMSKIKATTKTMINSNNCV